MEEDFREVVSMLSKKTRKRELLWQRYYLIAHLRDLGWTYEEIAKLFGMNHATMIHAYRMHNDWINDDDYIEVTKHIAELLEGVGGLDLEVKIDEGVYFLGRNNKNYEWQLDRFVGYELGWYIGKKDKYRQVKKIILL